MGNSTATLTIGNQSWDDHIRTNVDVLARKVDMLERRGVMWGYAG